MWHTRRRAAAAGAAAPCPTCGQRDDLVALGTRVDRARHWLAWRATRRLVCICLRCGAVSALPER